MLFSFSFSYIIINAIIITHIKNKILFNINQEYLFVDLSFYFLSSFIISTYFPFFSKKFVEYLF
jgi:hypothetical protein